MNERYSLTVAIALTFVMGLLLATLITVLNSYVLIIGNLLPAAISSAYLIIKFKKDIKPNADRVNNIIKLHVMPFIFFGLLIIPPIITIIMISFFMPFEIYLLVISFVMPLTFMNICFYLPLAIYDKYFNKSVVLDSSLYPTVTVIVPAFNEQHIIRLTLDSIIESDYPNKEIIVVDDGSSDQTYAVICKSLEKFPKKRFSVIRKVNGGKASAINLALRFAKGEIVIVIDADSIIERNTLRVMAKDLQRSDVIAVAGKVKVLNRTNILTNCIALEVAIAVNLLRPPFSLFGVVMIVPGAAGGFNKKAILQRGLYDNDTLTEDFDLTLKLLKTGRKIIGIPSTSYTEAPSTIKDLYRQRTRWNRGNFQTLIKHRDTITTAGYGMVQKFGYPITLLTFLIPPLLDMVVTVLVILAFVDGTWMSIIIPLVLFLLLQFLLSAIAILLDGKEQWRLMLYSPFAIIGYKQIINFIIIKSIFDVILRKDLQWTQTRGNP
jgi:cellulose synthase/poly-beta-1,6-N-acetylglucosamine synthase-like glycosyltransferase